MSTADLDQTAREIAAADRVLAFVGSGLSAASGVPTYRGEDGLFSDSETEKLARAGTLESEPERALEFYEEGRQTIRGYEPNPGHRALARLSERGTYTVATQNVDGLLERAADALGVDLAIHYLHGSLDRIRCHDCERVIDRKVDLSELPRCRECRGLLRPDVVLFGEMLPRDAFDASVDAAQRADVCLVLGTSGAVFPAAGLPRKAKRAGAFLAEINPRETELSGLCDALHRGKTGTLLPDLEERIQRLG
jgi:NAD-dependent deacetylase